MLVVSCLCVVSPGVFGLIFCWVERREGDELGLSG